MRHLVQLFVMSLMRVAIAVYCMLNRRRREEYRKEYNVATPHKMRVWCSGDPDMPEKVK